MEHEIEDCELCDKPVTDDSYYHCPECAKYIPAHPLCEDELHEQHWENDCECNPDRYEDERSYRESVGG